MQHQSQIDKHSELRSISVRLDGRASIEHQIDIHVQDLCIVSAGDFTLEEILQGLKIKGGKMPNLDYAIMKKLAQGLLSNMGWKEGNLLNRKLTKESDLAFSCFVELLEQVEEFRIAVSEINTFDLQCSIKLSKRLLSNQVDIKELSVVLVGILTSSQFPRSTDWKELVKESEYDECEKVLLNPDYAHLLKNKRKSQNISTSNANENTYPVMNNKIPINTIDTLPTDVKQLIYPPHALYFEKNYERLAEMYKTDLKNGLSSKLVSEYTKYYGSNKLPESMKTSISRMLWTQLSDFMIIILIIVAIIEVAVDQDYKAFTVLIAVVIINVTIGFYQELKAQKALSALSSLSVPKANVIRDGKQEYIDSILLVPGDLVVLDEGDAVPADLRLVEVSSLEIVEAILTGEGIPVHKSIRSMKKRTRKLPLGDCTGNAFMTTVVSKGRGKGIVVRSGENTEIGRISKAIVQQPNQKTALEKKLRYLGMILVAAAILLCVLIVVIGVLWKRDTRSTILSGIALAVSVIPEGLVAVVTITMAIGVQRMAQQGAIVRNLPSVETLGSVTHICSDKTGTLTEGKMGTGEIWAGDNTLFTFSESTVLDPSKGRAFTCGTMSLKDALDSVSKPSDIFMKDDTSHPQLVSDKMDKVSSGLLASCLVASLCNNASVVYNADEKAWKPIGDPTEIAMITATQKSQFPGEFWINKGFEKMGEYPFDSDRKLMSSLYSLESDLSAFVFVKGAPEQILNKCKGYLTQLSIGSFMSELCEMKCEEMTKDYAELVTERGLNMAHSGLRVLALAIRKVTKKEGLAILSSKNAKQAEMELVFVGLIGLIDPPKRGVAESVASCKKAGIKVIMITGDHIATGSSIATQIGIMDPNNSALNRAMRGYEVDLLSEEALATLDPFPVVFARVAMGGDGVNDAPAIKRADVGVAMGIGGTEITKQAADIVLSDDNFSTIVVAVKEGRKVYDNIRKFAVYLLSCNSAEIVMFILCASFNLEIPFTTIQILWANIIADIPPSLALGVEPEETDIMERPPKPSSEAVLNRESVIVMIIQGSIISFSSFIVYILSQGPLSINPNDNAQIILSYPLNILNPTHPSLKEQRSLAFFFLTSLQLVQGFWSQSILISSFRTGLLRNRWMVVAIAVSFILLTAGFYIPGLNDFLELQPLKSVDWLVMFIGVLIQFVLIESFKYVKRRMRAVPDTYLNIQLPSRPTTPVQKNLE